MLLSADPAWGRGGTPECPRLVPFGHVIYHNRNRVYIPTYGRFSQRDPNQTAMQLIAGSHSGRGVGAVSLAFRFEGWYGDGHNLYQYLGSNPLLRHDPLGLSWDPFDMVDDFLAETAAQKADFLYSITGSAHATAVVASYAMTMLPFPIAASAGEFALYLLGEQTLGEAALYASVGVVGASGGLKLSLMALSKFTSKVAQAGRNTHLVGQTVRVGTRVVVISAEMAEHIGKILPYGEAARLTRGFNHAIEAHHLLPVRYLDVDGLHHLDPKRVPAVIMTSDQHRDIERSIRAAEQRLQVRRRPGDAQMARRVLQEAYRDYPHYWSAIRHLF